MWGDSTTLAPVKLLKLQGRKICDAVQRKGTHWKGKTMTIRWMRGAPRRPGVDPQKPGLYVGTFASSKLHKSAVIRNRMRRRCREAMRLELADFAKTPTVQLLLSPRIGSLNAPFEDIRSDVKTFLAGL